MPSRYDIALGKTFPEGRQNVHQDKWLYLKGNILKEPSEENNRNVKVYWYNPDKHPDKIVLENLSGEKIWLKIKKESNTKWTVVK